MNGFLQRWHTLLTTMQGQRALVLFRVIAGCTMLSQLLAALPERHFLFGPDGVYPAALAADSAVFGVLSWVDSPWGFELVYFASIAVIVIWTMGLLLPISTIAVLVCWRSTFDRLPGLADGGDNLTQLILIYAVLCNLGGVKPRRWMQHVPTWAKELRAMVHNAGLVAIWVQVCIVYFVAGAAKMNGEAWRNGTALYYALSTDRFTLDGFVDPLLDSPLLLTFFAIVTVVFQVGFPFMVALNRRARFVALVLAMGFHVGIAVVMGLVSFAFFMLAADLTFLSDREVSDLAAFARRQWQRARGRFGSNTTPNKESRK